MGAIARSQCAAVSRARVSVIAPAVVEGVGAPGAGVAAVIGARVLVIAAQLVA